jgi:DNA ligase D-like protein (predicted 3'-phosphoesterase)
LREIYLGGDANTNMTLTEYRKKRDLKKSHEPDAVVHGRKKRKLIYCIQKHDASHLHYDLRLEFNGVLKSWAIPKLPPRTKGVKRLAIQTEDHPLGYANFEGIIPEGNYGAGKVEIWDMGNFKVIEDGKETIVISIDGDKLKGEYCLVKTNYGSKPEKSWLFFKR